MIVSLWKYNKNSNDVAIKISSCNLRSIVDWLGDCYELWTVEIFLTLPNSSVLIVSFLTSSLILGSFFARPETANEHRVPSDYHYLRSSKSCTWTHICSDFTPFTATLSSLPLWAIDQMCSESFNKQPWQLVFSIFCF